MRNLRQQGARERHHPHVITSLALVIWVTDAMFAPGYSLPSHSCMGPP